MVVAARWRNLVSPTLSIATVWLTILVGSCLCAAVKNGKFQFLQWTPERASAASALGAENNEIAISIRSGNGFSNPFHTHTGPTAWMPPAFPTLLATLYALCNDDHDSVLLWFHLFQLTSYGLLGTTLVTYASRSKGRPGLMAGIVVVSLWVSSFPVFQFAHGHVFEIWMTLIVLYAVNLQRTFTLHHAILSGVLAGAASLCFPAAALAWAFLTCYHFRTRPALLANALLAAILVASPWLGRNLAKFDSLYPIKSNSSYELWQSLVLSKDGLVNSTIFHSHPYFQDSSEHKTYQKLGEKRYLESKSIEAKEALRANPLRYAEHVKNRLVAAVLWEVPWYKNQSTAIWNLGIWRVWKILVLVCIGTIFWRRKEASHVALLSCSVMVCILLPYVLISYYERYSWPLLPLQVLIVYHALAKKTCLTLPLASY